MYRGQIIQKAAKYPHIDDLQQFVVELDEKHYLQCRLMACELRNHYVSKIKRLNIYDYY